MDLEFIRGGHFGVNFQGKHVMIRVAHIGIEETFILELVQSARFKKMDKTFLQFMRPRLEKMKLNVRRRLERYGHEKPSREEIKPWVIASIDTYHPISGLMTKLKSFRNFLRDYPQYVDRVVLIQFVGSIVQAFDNNEDHNENVNTIKKMRMEILEERDRIHKEFGTNCLIFEESNPPLEKRLALWTNADVILCSSLKDGLCIQVLEFVVCRKISMRMKDSLMVCSEFAGCQDSMRGVIRYNPFSVGGLEEALYQAFQLNPEERE
jgi:trehalose-6-phosphate synthase